MAAMEKRFGTVWQAEGAFRTTTFVHQKPNLRLMASARGRRSARYVAVEREEEEDEEASDSGTEATILCPAILAVSFL